MVNVELLQTIAEMLGSVEDPTTLDWEGVNALVVTAVSDDEDAAIIQQRGNILTSVDQARTLFELIRDEAIERDYPADWASTLAAIGNAREAVFDLMAMIVPPEDV